MKYHEAITHELIIRSQIFGVIFQNLEHNNNLNKTKISLRKSNTNIDFETQKKIFQLRGSHFV